MSEDACKEVLAILDMFSALERSYRQLPEKPAGVSERDVTFLGLDGNHETEQLGYAAFLIENQNRPCTLSATPLPPGTGLTA